MKKAVIILPSLQHGGLQRSLFEALSVVDRSKYDITVYVYSGYNPLAESLPKDVKVIIDTDRSHYMRKPKSIFLHLGLLLAKLCCNPAKIEKSYAKIKEYIHEEKSKYPAKRYFSDGVDVVISYAMGLCTQMALKIQADKRYLFFHSSDPDFHRDLSDKYFNDFDNIVAVGENVQTMLKENFPMVKEKIVLIKNYISAENIINLSNEYVVDTCDSKNATIITSVIRVDKEKGADLIVAAAEKLAEQNLSFKWYIVGDGATRVEIEEQITEKQLDNKVIITGYKKNPYPYIKACDVFVHPTYEESFGLAILEALILGKTIISTDTMGAREVLNSGKYGALVPINANAIAEEVSKIIYACDYKGCLQRADEYNNKDEKHTYKQKWEMMLNGETLS